MSGTNAQWLLGPWRWIYSVLLWHLKLYHCHRSSHASESIWAPVFSSSLPKSFLKIHFNTSHFMNEVDLFSLYKCLSSPCVCRLWRYKSRETSCKYSELTWEYKTEDWICAENVSLGIVILQQSRYWSLHEVFQSKYQFLFPTSQFNETETLCI